jgi:hypothetical protein
MDTLNIDAVTPSKSKQDRVVPQGYTVLDELTAVSELIGLGRGAEAKQRLDLLLNRNEDDLRRLD